MAHALVLGSACNKFSCKRIYGDVVVNYEKARL